MTAPNIDRLIARIAKLRARTVEAGCTPAEAESAAALAAKIMFEHGLEAADVANDAGDVDPLSAYELAAFGSAGPWRIRLLFALSKACLVRGFTSGGAAKGTFSVVGHRDNIAALREMYGWLEPLVRRQAGLAAMARENARDMARFIDAFCHGASETLASRIRAEADAARTAAATSTALSVVDNRNQAALDRMGIQLSRGRGIGRNTYDGYGAGRAAGSSMPLRRAPGVAGPRARLAA